MGSLRNTSATEGKPREARPSKVENYFFLPAIGFALPLRVRALVWVR